MASGVGGCRLPLFKSITDQNQSFTSLEELESASVTLPVSMALLSALHSFSWKDGNLKYIYALLDEIMKAPSYEFPAVPLYFARKGLTAFVPDEGEEKQLDWKAVVLQFHISILSVVEWSQLTRLPGSGSAQCLPTTSLSGGNIGSFASPVGSQIRGGGATPGMSFGQRRGFVGTFNDRERGSVNFGDLRRTAAPSLGRRLLTEARYSEVDLNLNTLFECSIEANFESSLFRGIVLAVNSRGFLDVALGHVIAGELSQEFSEASLVTCKIEDASAVFDEYMASVMRTLLSEEDESRLKALIMEDRVDDVMTSMEDIAPGDMVPHAREYVRQMVHVLCYHEDRSIAERAVKQASTIVNGHAWEIRDTEVITAENELVFRPPRGQVTILSYPCDGDNAFIVVQDQSLPTLACGFYDYCYGRLAPNGAVEVDLSVPCGRYIVVPANAKHEVIHELPAFNETNYVPFEQLTMHLQTLAESGVTAVHVPGAIERLMIHDLTSVTDHTCISKACGGVEDFKAFCDEAKRLDLRVLVDFVPHVSLRGAARKYVPYASLYVDEMGRMISATLDRSSLLNWRSLKLWDLLVSEMVELSDSCGVSGFFFGHVSHWDTVFSRDMEELLRVDPDGETHYTRENVIEGVIVQEKGVECGVMKRAQRMSPQLMHFMRRVWAKTPDAFCWVQCDTTQERCVINSGLIPANYEFRTVMQSTIDHSIWCEDVDAVNSNEALEKFYDRRKRDCPKGSFGICPFGGIMDGPHNVPVEGMGLAVDMLFLLTEVPLISGCLNTAIFVENAYSTIPMKYTDHLGQVIERPVKKPSRWSPAGTRTAAYLMDRAHTRTGASWALAGDISILPVSYDAHPMRAVLAVSRVCQQSKRCAVICMSFYKWPLIYEASVRTLDILKEAPADSVIEVTPLLNVARHEPSHYALNEVTKFGSSLFMDIDPFQTDVFEVKIVNPVPPNTMRNLVQEVFTRLERALRFSSSTVLGNNMIFNKILDCFEEEASREQLEALIKMMVSADNGPEVLRQALFFASRHVKDGQAMKRLWDDDLVQAREKKALMMLDEITKSQFSDIRELGNRAILGNKMGPICFVTPELGPFSRVGGISPMVWELAKELAQLGVDIHVISPYYNVSPKGETDYLKAYGIQYRSTIDVYAPSEVKIGVHYGLVDGVKCWFLHHYTYFAAPYQTGSSHFRLQLLVVMAKASLELCCQEQMIPAVIVTNDWMTGLVPAFGRKQFGNTFSGTKFVHIFHNLGPGYNGKLWPAADEMGAMHHIHQLPHELIVDGFDRSFDPSRSALLAADQWATVSKRYRDELRQESPYRDMLNDGKYSEAFAYSNGIRVQERLDAIAKFNVDHVQAKRQIQQKYFGSADDSKCLFIFIGRIVEQKGVFLIVDTFEELHARFRGQLQFIVGGQAAPGDHAYGIPCTRRMWDLKNRYPQNFWADPSQFFTDGILCCQGADYMLIPSLFEPSGIVQQEAFASSCPVIAFNTGGLADTVFEYDRNTQQGNGFVFWNHQHRDYIMAVERATEVFNDKKEYGILRKNARESVLSTVTVATQWAREFARLFGKIYLPPRAEEEEKKEEKEAAKPE